MTGRVNTARGRCGERQWMKLKRQVLERDGRTCWICDAQTVSTMNHPRAASLDHVIPLARGGGNELDNLRIACRACNTERADHDLP